MIQFIPGNKYNFILPDNNNKVLAVYLVTKIIDRQVWGYNLLENLDTEVRITYIDAESNKWMFLIPSPQPPKGKFNRLKNL